MLRLVTSIPQGGCACWSPQSPLDRARGAWDSRVPAPATSRVHPHCWCAEGPRGVCPLHTHEDLHSESRGQGCRRAVSTRLGARAAIADTRQQVAAQEQVTGSTQALSLELPIDFQGLPFNSQKVPTPPKTLLLPARSKTLQSSQRAFTIPLVSEQPYPEEEDSEI